MAYSYSPDAGLHLLLLSPQEFQRCHPGNGSGARPEQGPAWYLPHSQRYRIRSVQDDKRTSGRPVFQAVADEPGACVVVHHKSCHLFLSQTERGLQPAGRRGKGNDGTGLSDRFALGIERLCARYGLSSLRGTDGPLVPPERAGNQAKHLECLAFDRSRTGDCPGRMDAIEVRL